MTQDNQATVDAPSVGSQSGPAGSRSASPAIVWTCLLYAALIIVLALAMLMKQELRGYALEALSVVLALMPIAIIVAVRARNDAMDGARAERMARAIETMTQEAGLSEAAKGVLHRRQEREILRRAIEQDISDHDWDAAMVLVGELAERFGYRTDAEEFRSKIERARAQTQDQRVVDALMGLDDLIRGRQWAEAYAEAARVQRLYPDSHRIHGLRERVEEARTRYKKELERGFLLASERERVDEAMMLLKELDQYLTPTEAEPYREVARGVIGKLRENLGVRFKLCVQDHRWEEAMNVGERIIGEFPNTRMAAEVREVMPELRERAGVGAR